MTEREKMAQIIAEYLCPQGKAHARLYGAERMCYSRDNFAECEKVSKCVDTLIEAGIGDKSKHRLFISKDGTVCKQLYSCEEVEQIANERDEYKHRAEVVERALWTACVNLIKDEDNVDMELLARVVYTHYLRKAENELTEEGKDGQMR